MLDNKDYIKIPWFDDYLINISNNTVLSLKWKLPRVLAKRISSWWHICVILYKSWKWKSYWIHRLVMLVKEWPCPEWMEVLHWDWNPLNNNPCNLRYWTRSENVKDSVRHWTHNNHWKYWSNSFRAKPVNIYSKDNVFIKSFWSIIECAKEFNLKIKPVWFCVRRNFKKEKNKKLSVTQWYIITYKNND